MDVSQYGAIEYNFELAANDTESILFFQVAAFLWSDMHSKGILEAETENIEKHPI